MQRSGAARVIVSDRKAGEGGPPLLASLLVVENLCV
jgi:hypothetical protein